MGCSSLVWVSSLVWISLGDLWGLWNLKGIAGVQQRTLGLLVDKIDVTNQRGRYLAIYTDYSDVFGYVSKFGASFLAECL